MRKQYRTFYSHNTRDIPGEYFPMPKSIFRLGLTAGEILSAKVRDSEERLARLLFKLAVDQNLLAHAVADCFEFSPAEIDNMRNDSVREVKETNGTIRTDEILNKGR